ncbi:MAG: methyltransferase domain-containing protein [Cyanothece sp. SIO2G6]|nr:methyltransferase domain-containing protein [Cyanothece sp. SIO2G6]
MEDLQLLIDLHQGTLHQGPGSEGTTLKAFGLTGLDPEATLAVGDFGCGTGSAAIALAHHLPHATIQAVDLCAEFIDILQQRIQSDHLTDRLSALTGSIDDLPFADESFDLIWSEGAIYNIGFEAGLTYWRQLLRDRGLIAVSEITWLTASRPAEIDEYWQNEYPEIGTVANKLSVIERQGFSPLAFFVLPPACWLDHYYGPLEQKFAAFLEHHGHSDQAQALIASQQQEIALYRTYQAYFSYGFYIAQKV